MSGVNNITGDKLVSKITTETYRANYDEIFKNSLKAVKTYYNGKAVLVQEPEEWVTKEAKDENLNT